MVLLGWAVVGIVIGAAGTELLRAGKRGLVEKVENAATRFVDALCHPNPSNDEEGEEADDAAEDG